MILVRRKYLYFLVVLFLLMVIFGEIKYFHALRSIALKDNLDFKFEVESFIFVFINISLIVYIFLVFFIGRSTNLLKRLDKLIELSDFGKYDISNQLAKLGIFGEKIKLLLSNLSRLNDIKTLKISVLSDMIRTLLGQIDDKTVYIFDRNGQIAESNKTQVPSAECRGNTNKVLMFNDIFTDLNSEDIYDQLDRNRSMVSYKNINILLNSEQIMSNVNFNPIINSEGKVSNIIAFIQKSS